MAPLDHYAVFLMNNKTGLAAMGTFLDNFMGRQNISRALLQRLGVVLDELMCNIISYAYPDGQCDGILVLVEVWQDKLVTHLEDRGMPFDPFSGPDPNTALCVNERPIGGLGVFLVKKLVSTYRYERTGNTNRVTLEQDVTQNGV